MALQEDYSLSGFNSSGGLMLYIDEFMARNGIAATGSAKVFTGFYRPGRTLEQVLADSFPEVKELTEKDKKRHPDDYSQFVDGNASVLLMGECNAFAAELQAQLGYQVFKLCDKAGKLIHFFCLARQDGAGFFVDVRGMTNDKEAFLTDEWRMARAMKREGAPFFISADVADLEDEIDVFDYEVGRRLSKCIIEMHPSFYLLR